MNQRFVRLIGLAVLVGAMAACDAGVDSTSLSTAPPSPASPTAASPASTPTSGSTDEAAALTARLAAGIGTNGTVSLDTALRAFSATIAALPGVDAGLPPTDAVVSGFAAGWIADHVDELTNEQSAVVAEALGEADAGDLVQSFRRATAPPDVERLQSIVIDVLTFVRSEMALPTTPPYDVRLVDPKVAQVSQAQLWSWWNGQQCAVLVREGAFDVYLPDELDLYTDLASAVVRCELLAQLPSSNTPPPWLVDGFSSWAACHYMAEVRQSTSRRCDAMWTSYFSTGSTPLFRRSDDALGFFGQLDSVVSRSEPMPGYVWTAIASALGQPSAAAYAGLVEPVAERWPFEWASGQLQDRSLPAEWNIVDPTATGAAAAQPMTVTPDVSEQAAADPYTVGLWDVRADGVDIVTIEGDGFARVASVGPSAQSDDEVSGQQFSTCMKPGGCACPDQSLTLPEMDVLHLAVTGHVDGSSFDVSGSSMEDFCNDDTADVDASTSDACADFPSGEVGRLTGQAIGEATTPDGFDPNTIGGQVGCVWTDAPGWSAQIFPASGAPVPSAKDYSFACRFWMADVAVSGDGWVACVGRTPEGYGYADILTSKVNILLTTAPGISVEALTDAAEAVGKAYR